MVLLSPPRVGAALAVRLVPTIVLALCCAGPRPAAAAGPPPKAAAHARYVVLGQAPGGETVAYARLILDPGQPCPQVTGGARPLTMTPRQNPYNLPVVVCEALIGAGADLVSSGLSLAMADGVLPLPAVGLDPHRVAVFGDTGCKLGDAPAGCPAGAPAEPFASLAAAAAATRPDLVLHMGDYNYRGTPGGVLFTVGAGAEAEQQQHWTYDAGDGSKAGERCEQAPGAGFLSQSAANSTSPDTWEAWRDDFFRPAADLLAAAPWVVARGNHELCSRAGPGWFYFLDPSSDLAPGGGRQLACPRPDAAADPIDNVVLTPPYAVDLGTLTVLMIDSANACDFFTEEAFAAAYSRQMAWLGRLAPGAGTAFVVSHRPLWAVEGYQAGSSTGCTAANGYACLNRTLQAALDRGLGDALPASVELLLAGHMHRFQALTFTAGDRPPLLVVGNGGVHLEDFPPVGSFGAEVDGVPAAVLATAAEVSTPAGDKPAYGYLDLRLGAAASGWSASLVNPTESLTIATCGSAQAAAGAVCALAPGVTPKSGGGG